LKSQLLQKLLMPPNAVVENMRGGGCNAGMWIVRDISQTYVLKLTKSSPMFMGKMSESARLLKLSRSHPSLVDDLAIAFPCKIFHCLGPDGSNSHDMLVMRQVPGVQLSEVIRQKLQGNQQELMGILEHFGAFLAAFHSRYNGMQHGDLTPANICFCQSSGRFTLIDIADLGPQNPLLQPDVDRFISGIKGLCMLFGAARFEENKARFEAGYNTCRRGRLPS